MNLDWLDPFQENNLVSIIIPCHNQERFLPACLKSLSEQNYRPLEIIIIDDGSTDLTRTIIDDFKNKKKNGISVKYIFQSKQGAPHARNVGCKISTGEFIQFLDGDDILCHDKLSRQVKEFTNSKDTDVMYGDAQYLINFDYGIEKKGRVISCGITDDIIASLLAGSWVPLFSYLTKRSVIQHCGPWNTEFPIVQDIDYFLRIALSNSTFHYKPGIDGFYRKHSLSSIAEQSALIRGITWIKILTNAEDHLRKNEALTDKRIFAMIECYRRIARQTFPLGKEIFKKCLNKIYDLSPDFLPRNRKARSISSIPGMKRPRNIV